MGNKSYELGEGTLYFGDVVMPVKCAEVNTTDEYYVVDEKCYVKKIDASAEFTATISLNFRSMIKLFGFRNALKFKVKNIILKIKNLVKRK